MICEFAINVLSYPNPTSIVTLYTHDKLVSEVRFGLKTAVDSYFIRLHNATGGARGVGVPVSQSRKGSCQSKGVGDDTEDNQVKAKASQEKMEAFLEELRT
jgi:hypothetical protein